MRQLPCGLDVRHMRDQRIESRAALGGVETGDGLAIAGIGAEPVDGLGRKRDQPTGGQAGCRRLDRLRDLLGGFLSLGFHHPRSRLDGHFAHFN